MISIQYIGAAQILVGLVFLLFLKPVVENRDTTGSLLFGVLIVGIALWSAATGIDMFLPSQRLSVLRYYLLLSAVQVASLGWFVLSCRLTGQSLSRRLLVVLGAVTGGVVVLIWTDPIHGLLVGPETTMDGPRLVPDRQPVFWIHGVAGYTWMLAGIAVFSTEVVRSQGLGRRQMALFVLAGLPALIANP